MKQTEIGLIPDDWEVKKLEEICYQIGDIDHKMPASVSNGIPYLMTGDFIGENEFNFADSKKISLADYNSLSKKIKPELNDVIFARYASIGAVRFIETIKPFLVSYSCAILKIKDSYEKKFVFYSFFSDILKNQEDLAINTGTQANIGIESLKNFLLPLPPFAEQQRIAKALSDIDALISTTEKLIQKKKNIKQGSMQNLLTGKKRLPGFAKSTRTKMTELGEIPEDWEVKPLSEIFEFKPNNTFTRDCLNDSKGEYQNVHYGDVLIKYPSILDCSKETIPFINEGINVKFSKYGIVEGDIIIADTAEDETVGKVVEIFNLGEKKIVSGLHTFLCRKITDDFAPKWLGYFMNQAIFHNQLLPFITGTKVSAISRTAIQNVKVLIPSKEEQTAIANVLSSMDKEIETLNTKLEKYRNLKTAMMQQLLTGKIRLIK